MPKPLQGWSLIHFLFRIREGLTFFDHSSGPLQSELSKGKFTILPCRDPNGEAPTLYSVTLLLELSVSLFAKFHSSEALKFREVPFTSLVITLLHYCECGRCRHRPVQPEPARPHRDDAPDRAAVRRVPGDRLQCCVLLVVLQLFLQLRSIVTFIEM